MREHLSRDMVEDERADRHRRKRARREDRKIAGVDVSIRVVFDRKS
jgi:hypothetical protein